MEDAIQDFRTGAAQRPAGGELQNKAKDKLYDALTQYFQQHFDKAEKYQEDYAALCTTDLPPTADRGPEGRGPPEDAPSTSTSWPRARRASAS